MDEEVVEVATKVAFTFKPMVLAATGVVSLAAGTALGLIVGTRRAEKKYAALAAAEIEEAKQHYSMLHKKGNFATPEAAAEALLVETRVETDVTPIVVPEEVVETIRSYGGDPRPQLTEDNIFQKERIPERTLLETSEKFVSPVNPHGPYVITEDEFNDGEVGYTQVSITYYAADDILADDKDAPVDDVEALVGDALSRFGEGVNEAGENVVFVRNTRVELDFEITRSFGSYGAEVAGLNTHLQHSDVRIPRRRRRLQDE